MDYVFLLAFHPTEYFGRTRINSLMRRPEIRMLIYQRWIYVGICLLLKNSLQLYVAEDGYQSDESFLLLVTSFYTSF